MRLLSVVLTVLAIGLPTAAWAKGPIVEGTAGLWDILVAVAKSISL